MHMYYHISSLLLKNKNSHSKIRTNNLNFKKTHQKLKLVIKYDPKAKQLFAYNPADSPTSINTVKQLVKQGFYPN